jgi:hypothetical protein
VGLQQRLLSSPGAFAATLEVQLKGLDRRQAASTATAEFFSLGAPEEEKNRRPKRMQYWRSNETRTPRLRPPLHVLCPHQIGMQW